VVLKPRLIARVTLVAKSESRGALQLVRDSRSAVGVQMRLMPFFKGDAGPPGVFTEADLVTQPQADFDCVQVLSGV